MSRNFFHIVLLFTAVAFLHACSGGKKRIPSLQETYSNKDKKPFGANIAYRQVEAMYDANVVQDKKKDFKETWSNISDTGSLYICLAQKLFVSAEEVEAMLEYVEAGNSLFISAGSIDRQLLDKINCGAVYFSPEIEENAQNMQPTSVKLVLQPGTDYQYYYYPFRNYFNQVDSSKTRILGYNANDQPNSIVYFHGKGRLYLHCEPRAFSNYFLLKKNNYEYLKNTVAFTKTVPQHVYWDDYYNKMKRRRQTDNDNSFSTFGEIMKHPPLKAAFWLSLLLLLLYIFFGGKRVQRIIRQVKPNENTTVTFTETIGRLYLQKKDNKNIADKMITYFNEYIRNTYFVNTNHINDDFVTLLGRKSGVQKDKVESLYRTIQATQNSSVVSDYQLLSLQDQVQQFYKTTGRNNN